MKPDFRMRRVLAQVRGTFPYAKILSYHKLEGGLVSPTFKVSIVKPRKVLAIKIFKAKNVVMIRKNNRVLNFLHQKGFPVPKIYSDKLFARNGVVVMDYLPGRIAAEVYDKSSSAVRRKLLRNSGRLLRRIHELRIPEFWVHHKHEVKDISRWLAWTKKRVTKYLSFAKTNLDPKYYLFLCKEFAYFSRLLNKNIEFVPLHWDYHLSNLIASSDGTITGLFDFDNAMKGHNLADLGQANYWLQFRHGSYNNFGQFLAGYGVASKKEKQLIKGYFLLHLVAVTRSQWGKKRLRWLIDRHIQMLDRMMV